MPPALHRLKLRSFAAWRWVNIDAPRQAYVAITSLLLVGSLVIGGVIFLTADTQDQIARRKSTDLAKAVIGARERDLAKTNHDYAWWADSVTNLVDKPDAGWAGDNIGQPLFDTFGISGAFVYDAANRAVFAFQDGVPVKTDPMGESKASLEALLAAARAKPGEESIPQTGIVMFLGQPQLASAAMISYTDFRSRWQSGQVPYVLVFLRSLDPDYLKGLGSDYGFSGMGWVGAEPNSATSPPVENAGPSPRRIITRTSESSRTAWST